jgi:hypothetical protein
MGDITVNGTAIDEVDDEVYFNGTAIATYKGVYLNGTRVWTKHPYTPNSVLFTYSWNNGSNINNFITDSAYYAGYTDAFASAPSYTQGSGSPDSRLQFVLADGFRVSYYNQAEYGTDSDGAGAGNTGGTYRIYVGNTVSGLSGVTYSLSKPGSGNGGSSFKILYEGRED